LLAVGLTAILVPDKPSVQFKVPPAHALAVKEVELPLQIVEDVGEIKGFEGIGLTVTIVVELLSLVQLFKVQIAE
jgi:hypothetical protein